MTVKLPQPPTPKLYEYDSLRKRLWICGQRCHHGATGSLLAALGVALMAHDWKDRTIWFTPGHGNQP